MVPQIELVQDKIELEQITCDLFAVIVNQAQKILAEVEEDK